MAGLLAALWKAARDAAERERAALAVERRLVNPRIERPFYVKGGKHIRIGRDVQVHRHCLFHGGGMRWSGGRGHLTIGDHCWFGEGVLLYGAGGITIGHDSGLGPGTKVFSSRDDYSMAHAHKDHIVHLFAPVRIGDYVRVFSDVVIGPGVTIGDGAVIGAGSLVQDDIPPWVVAAGTPARVIGPRDRDVRAERLAAAGATTPLPDPGARAPHSAGPSG